MRRLLIADSGPLFSLAAGDLLDILSHLRVAITDIVKEETIDRGLIAGCSVEAQRLLAYYTRNARSITVYETQVGAMVRADRARDPSFKSPRNLGEISIQSLLIEFQVRPVQPPPLVLFEDAWFLRNATGLARPFGLISTRAFLLNAEKAGLIQSAETALEAIRVGGRSPAATTLAREFRAAP